MDGNYSISEISHATISSEYHYIYEGPVNGLDAHFRREDFSTITYEGK